MADTGSTTKRSHDHPPHEHHKRVRSSNADEAAPSMAVASPAASPGNAKPSFYQRQLPESCVGFSSPHGRRLLMESLSAESLDTHIYFDLSAQFRTQEEPTFCGLSTLVMCLNGEVNIDHRHAGHQPPIIPILSGKQTLTSRSPPLALKLDPHQHWKGPWRWYHESMLDCCKPIEDVKGAVCTNTHTHTLHTRTAYFPARIFKKDTRAHVFAPSILLHGRRASLSTSSLVLPGVTVRLRTFIDQTLTSHAMTMALAAGKPTVSAAKVVAVPVTRTTRRGVAALASVVACRRSVSKRFENRSARRVPRVGQLQSFRITARRSGRVARDIFRPSLPTTRWRTRLLFWMLRGLR
jgi:hypothetical protein